MSARPRFIGLDLRDGGQDPQISGAGSTSVPRTEEITGFAHYTGPEVCRSRAGRWRPAHEFIGGTCVYCDQGFFDTLREVDAILEDANKPEEGA